MIMAVKQKIKSLPNVVDYFKELPIYKNHIEKPKNKRLKNIDLHSELPFYEELNGKKTNHDMLNDLLNETKGFNYQITLKVMLKNASQMEKLNLLQFILIQQQKQR